jgi:hypothetical protein
MQQHQAVHADFQIIQVRFAYILTDAVNAAAPLLLPGLSALQMVLL